MAEEHYLSMDQLRVGLYVYLDLKWFERLFAFGHFKIKSEEQIKVIRSLSRKSVRYAPELCNPNAIADALTPHEALSLMFAKLRGKFDPKPLLDAASARPDAGKP